ncbi:hypothetical protein BJ138DRAFT_1063571 [Hygrophoropsis aurantiaca]|uniref:Uncharacterized protein n=1 Tax=Hygrophoropsis aurantiaca TaxID=72124 RepID=A0ACB8AED2_9AGAM|nr:hypothetical protein BJ138DRAFT_1063571 [Hygrophoropsis aurantiaca]
MSSNFASSFAPYTPPPDVTLAPAKPRTWFPVSAPSLRFETSYQSGGIPSFDTSISGGGVIPEETEAPQHRWETRYGIRADLLAAFAYLIGPLSALALLIFETRNDYVRFHAYQSAILTTSLLVARIFASLLAIPSWIRLFLTFVSCLLAISMSIRAYRDVRHHDPTHYQLPIIGDLAGRWVSAE